MKKKQLAKEIQNPPLPKPKLDISVIRLWNEYQSSLESIQKKNIPSIPPSVWYFGDNQQDADELAALALNGTKRATATSLWFFEHRGEAIPQMGELHVIINWEGIAQCIIETTKVDIIPYNEITEEHAKIEGEGDGSLEYWKNAHKDYFPRELIPCGRQMTQDMPVVFEQFRVIWPKTE